MGLHIVYKNDDEKAFELLFRKYYVRLCGYANKFLNNIDDSEEIVQEVFLTIWKRKNQIGLKDGIRPLLFKSVQNHCLNYINHQKVVDRYYKVISEVYKADGEYNENDSVVYMELEQRIEKAIGTLPDQCEMIFKMSRNDGLKYLEIAEKLNISVKTVETQMSRALAKLRNELKDYLVVLFVAILSRL